MSLSFDASLPSIALRAKQGLAISLGADVGVKWGLWQHRRFAAMTMSHDQVLQLVDDLYGATGVGDFDKAEEYLTDDFFITEADTLPFAGVYKGKTALRDLFTKVMGMMDVSGLNRVQTTSGGDYAVTILSFEFVDPALEPAHLCELFRFRDGKICEIRPYYFDPAPITAACNAKAVKGS
jgi:ketosteroid isomerase-like protein